MNVYGGGAYFREKKKTVEDLHILRILVCMKIELSEYCYL